MKLTSERYSGIKTGYWSAVKKDELVQKLGEIEDRAPRLLAEVCDTFCTVSMDDKVCRGCAVNTLVRLIDI